MTQQPPYRALRIAGRPLPVIGRARMYDCFSTPYDTTHLGHAATFVWADTVASGPAARTTPSPPREVPLRPRHGVPYGAGRPRASPGRTNYIEQVAALAAALLANGTAYLAGGRVYFRGC